MPNVGIWKDEEWLMDKKDLKKEARKSVHTNLRASNS